MNKEILMVVVLCISVFLLASAIYVYIEDEYVVRVQDSEYHSVTGQISGRYATAYDVTIEFVNGSNITFSGWGILNAAKSLDNNTNYTFHWKYSSIGKGCYQINAGNDVVWQRDIPITMEMFAGFVIFWIAVGLLFFAGIRYNRRAEERKK